MTDLIHGIIAYSLIPFDKLSPFWGLTLFSIITGAFMLLVVKWTTRQGKLERARDQMSSAIYEIRLYLDSPGQIIKSQIRLFFCSFIYMAQVLPALLVMIIPLTLFFLHLEPRYSFAPLPLEKPALVEIELAKGVAGEKIIVTSNNTDLKITAPPFYDKKDHRLFVRVSPIKAGEHHLTIKLETGQTLTKLINAGTKISNQPVAIEKIAGFSGLLAYRSFEKGLPKNSGIHKIIVPHSYQDEMWVGIPMPWWVYWLIISTITALTLKKPFGVVL